MEKQHIEEVLQIIEEAMLKIKICIGRQNGKSILQPYQSLTSGRQDRCCREDRRNYIASCPCS